MIIGLVVSVLLVGANGAFVAVEFALLASGRQKLESLADEGNNAARLALEASRDLNLQLAGAQFGITVASLLLGFVAEPTLAHLIEDALHRFDLGEATVTTVGFAVALSVVVFAHMVFGEMVPKNLALAAPERTLLALMYPARAYLFVAGPIVRFLDRASRLIARLFRVEVRDELLAAATADEIAAMVATSREEGLIAEVEHQLLTGALDLGARRVRSIMVPRDRIVAVSRTATPAEAEQVVVASGHSRIVVTGQDLDDVLGFIHAKELLTLGAAAQDRQLPLGRIRQMPVISPDLPVDDVLLIMQRARIHLGLVRGSDGRTLGIMTLEDVLEELVGDIIDESDPETRTRRRRRRTGRSDPAGRRT